MTVANDIYNEKGECGSSCFYRWIFGRPSPCLHAKQKSYDLEPPDESFINDQDQHHGGCANDQVLQHNAQPPLHNEETNQQNHRLMEDIERQDRLVTVCLDLVAEVQKLCAHGQYKDDPAPGV